MRSRRRSRGSFRRGRGRRNFGSRRGGVRALRIGRRM